MLMVPDDWGIGALSVRGEPGLPFDPNLPSYPDSAFEAAGSGRTVRSRSNSELKGVDFTAWFDAVPGDWFVVDYHAESVGVCSIGLYADLLIDEDLLIDFLSFHHVPSRDFNRDTIVNFADFVLLASKWRQQVAPDWDWVNSVDLDGDGYVGMFDIALFSEYWLERTDCNDPNGTNVSGW
jgi:hypothetical protein